MEKRLNIGYGFINGTYWMYYGVIGSFASAFLLARGYTNWEIGLILAAGSVLSAFLQPILADLSDKSHKSGIVGVSQKTIIALMILGVSLFFLGEKTVVLASVYVVMYALQMAFHPLLNSMAFYFSRKKSNINFGIGRSVGSLGYSSITAIMGILMEKVGADALPIVGEIVLLSLLASVIFTNEAFKKDEADPEKEANAIATGGKDDIGLFEFFGRHKMFVLMNVGILLIFFQNHILNGFMFQVVQNVGGDASDMGTLFAVLAMIEIPGFLLFNKIRQKISYQNLLIFSGLCFLAKIVTMFIATNMAMVYVAHIFHVFSFPIFISAMVGFANTIMARGEAVKGQSLSTMCITISGVFASISGGLMLDSAGAKFMLLIASLVTALGVAVVWFSAPRVKHEAL